MKSAYIAAGIMATTLFATTAMSAAAFAQSDKPAAVKSADTKPAAPLVGNTSFTMGQAKSQMEKRGYTVATDPVKDSSGIWYAEATKGGGSTVRLMVDYQGNVFERKNAKVPVPGLTKLTADKARQRMIDRGYNVTSNPIKDDQGIWYAEGNLDGNKQPVQVMVDYQGNVFESGEYAGHPSSAPGIEPTLPNPVKASPLPNAEAKE